MTEAALPDALRLAVFHSQVVAIADEMGAALMRTAYSPNIKERRDYSCAVFDARARMVGQAAHIPVHLGSMPASVAAAVDAAPMEAGDTVVLNDPFRGGTHLPDLTVVSPVYQETELVGYVANRAHHADIGGASPGSMGVTTSIHQEGLRLPPVHLVRGGQPVKEVFDLIGANVRTPEERLGDLRAQLAANHRGVDRLLELVARYGVEVWPQRTQSLRGWSERLMREALRALPDGVYAFDDQLDDDGQSEEEVTIRVTLTVDDDSVVVDFAGSSPQTAGCVNAVLAITASAVYYCFLSLLAEDVPINHGCFTPITVKAPAGTVVNALPPAAVSAGNVETSQRIVDVVLGALSRACPDRIPAASCGSMNNLLLGGIDPRTHAPFAYYETIGGGAGAHPCGPGLSAVHTHMTNTLNTPVEALEYAYPLRVLEYAIARGSGGAGRCAGGDGIIREIEVLTSAEGAVLSERRRHAPYGVAGGCPGAVGVNELRSGDDVTRLPGKARLKLHPGDCIRIQTPGGGGWGSNDDPPSVAHTGPERGV